MAMATTRTTAEDIAELKRLIGLTTSSNVRLILEKALKSMEMKEIIAPSMPQPVMEPVTTGPSIQYENLDKYGWEDAGYGKEKVSIYLTSGVDGVHLLSQDQIECNFDTDGFDLKIHGLANGTRNVRLVKTNLEKEIDPKRSSIRVKTDRLTITLIKAKKEESWMQLTRKSNKTPASKAGGSDPTAGIMDIMKNMYDEGDDEMKRTISKAWSESRNKAATGGEF